MSHVNLTEQIAVFTQEDGSVASAELMEGDYDPRMVQKAEVPYMIEETKVVLNTDFHVIHPKPTDLKSKELLLNQLELVLPGFSASKGNSFFEQTTAALAANKKYYLLARPWAEKLINCLFDETQRVEEVGPIDQTEILDEDGQSLAWFVEFFENDRRGQSDIKFEALKDMHLAVSAAVWEFIKEEFGGGPEFCFDSSDVDVASFGEPVITVICNSFLSLLTTVSTNLKEVKRMYICKHSKTKKFKNKLMELYNLTTAWKYKEVRIHDYYQNRPTGRIDKTEYRRSARRLSEIELVMDNQILIELPVSDGARNTYLVNYAQFEQMHYERDDEYMGSKQPIVKGGVGLRNIGNTCYMNSTVQCLSNIPVLKDYLTSGKFQQDINQDNALGYGGKLAHGMSGLLAMLWSTSYTSIVSPDGFKRLIDEIKPEFAGFQQHDSQEFLSQMLDGLHEDLNRVRQKPYTENVTADGRPDSVVAKEAIETYRKRNDSKISDLFTGMFKSTVACPDPSCKNVSVTFDPYMILPLPLETSETHYQIRCVVVIPEKITAENPIRQEFVITPKDGHVAVLTEILQLKLGMTNSSFVMFRLENSRLREYHDLARPLSMVTPSHTLLAYESKHADSYHYLSVPRPQWSRSLDINKSYVNMGSDSELDERDVPLDTTKVIGYTGCPFVLDDYWEGSFQFEETDQLLRVEVTKIVRCSPRELKKYCEYLIKSCKLDKNHEEIVYLSEREADFDYFIIHVTVDTQEKARYQAVGVETESSFAARGVYRVAKPQTAVPANPEVAYQAAETPKFTVSNLTSFLKKSKKKKKTAVGEVVTEAPQESATVPERDFDFSEWDDLEKLQQQADSTLPLELEQQIGLLDGRIWLRPISKVKKYRKNQRGFRQQYGSNLNTMYALQDDPSRDVFTLVVNMNKIHQTCWGSVVGQDGFPKGELIISRSKSMNWNSILGVQQQPELRAVTSLPAYKPYEDVYLSLMCNKLNSVRSSFRQDLRYHMQNRFVSIPFVYLNHSAQTEHDFISAFKEELIGYIKLQSEATSQEVDLDAKIKRITDDLLIARADRNFSHTPAAFSTRRRQEDSAIGNPIKLGKKELMNNSQGELLFLVALWSSPADADKLNSETSSGLPDVVEFIRPMQVTAPVEGLSKPMNFYSALELFSKTEKLNQMNAWYCNKCQTFQEAYKQLQIWSLPEVLVVQFKRFSQKGGKSTADKLEVPVEFPIEVNLKDFTLSAQQQVVDPDACFDYDLKAVSSHIGGGLGQGHYVAAARNETDGKWYEYDDNNVTEITSDKMKEKISKEAYVIFYVNKKIAKDTLVLPTVQATPAQEEAIQLPGKAKVQEDLSAKKHI